MATLYLLCGVPACGKSTFANKVYGRTDVYWASRDAIRFELIQEDDEYFIHENEVFDIFIRQIVHHLQAGRDVMADATHLHKQSRYKTINAVKKYFPEVQVSCIWFMDSFHTDLLLARNAKREGRARVPDNVIVDMRNKFITPHMGEYKYKDIFCCHSDGTLLRWNEANRSYEWTDWFDLPYND